MLMWWPFLSLDRGGLAIHKSLVLPARLAAQTWARGQRRRYCYPGDYRQNQPRGHPPRVRDLQLGVATWDQLIKRPHRLVAARGGDDDPDPGSVPVRVPL